MPAGLLPSPLGKMILASRHFHRPFPQLANLIAVVVLAYPVLLFLVRGGMNGSLFLLALIAIVVLYQQRQQMRPSMDTWTILFGVAMSSGLLAVLVSQAYHDDISGRYFDSDARFLLAFPVMLALRRAEITTLTVVQYGFPLGALCALVMTLSTSPSTTTFAQTAFINHIHLGDMALMLGILSVLSINWEGKDNKALWVLKIAGLAAGLTVSAISSARGGWIALPVIVAVVLYYRDKSKFVGRMAFALLLIALIVLLSYFFVKPIHDRLWMIYSDLSNYASGKMDTSIGIRLQLWQAAIHLIIENPLVGVGAGGFGDALDKLVASGYITPMAAQLGKAEVHNEILAQTVRFGMLGLGFILAVYFVPLYMFVRATRSHNQVVRGAALMGMSLTLGFFIYGLTVETFDLKMTAAFYSLTVAVLLAIATSSQAGGDQEPARSRG